MISGFPWLSVAIWLPILFGVLVLATGNDRNAPLARIIALIGAVLGFLATLPLYLGFNKFTSAMQFVCATAKQHICRRCRRRCKRLCCVRCPPTTATTRLRQIRALAEARPISPVRGLACRRLDARFKLFRRTTATAVRYPVASTSLMRRCAQ